MKKVIILFLSMIYIFTVPAYAAKEIPVYLNGERVFFEQAPIIRSDSTLVPFRAIFERLGMKVDWNGGERKVTAKNDDTEITLFIDNDKMTVNGEAVALNTPPIIYNDFTMVPLRAVSEAAGAEVDWDGEARTIYITVGENDLEKWRIEVMKLTNEERRKEGLDPLVWSDTLALLAEIHCEDMIERGFFDHVNPDGETPFDRFNMFDMAYWAAGENIAAGQKSPEAVVEEWMQSPTHRENILNPNFKSVGISVIEGGKYKIYWVQEFAWFK